jgi:hypothetical protein
MARIDQARFMKAGVTSTSTYSEVEARGEKYAGPVMISPLNAL